MLSASKGTISHYDHLFRKYAPVALVDWTLLAAQCYQESCFDPQAHSWAGACGLMQIMPSTADHLSLPRQQIYEPEPNVAAAARYMRELQTLFLDITNPAERIRFALAAYNGGANHVRDAMALAKKYGAIPQRWSDVRRYILLLQDPRYYNDPVVSSGYMRGSETAQYVDNIMQRHSQYRLALATGAKVKVPVNVPVPVDASTASPHRAAKKNKWRKD
jgi:membrane-bound lytic murein transglycosylase F